MGFWQQRRRQPAASQPSAKTTGASLTGVYVIAPYVAPAYGEGFLYASYVTSRRYKEITGREAKKALAEVEISAESNGIKYRSATVAAADPWQGIIRAARGKHCDLIVMASHGRRGLSGLMLGSETTKVLTHTKIPVLVCR